MPTPVPTPAPPPIYTHPFTRFVHAMPGTSEDASDEMVDCIVEQNGTSVVFDDFVFGMTSNWESVFDDGDAVITITDPKNRSQILMQTTRTLTKGPLVIALRDPWPLKNDYQVTAVASSFPPVKLGQASVRLFNLVPDRFGGEAAVNFDRDDAHVAQYILYPAGGRRDIRDVADAKWSVTAYMPPQQELWSWEGSFTGANGTFSGSHTVYLVGSNAAGMSKRTAITAIDSDDSPFVV